MLIESSNLLLATESAAPSGGKATVTRPQGRRLIDFSASLDAYEGTYRHPAYGVIVIKMNTQKMGYFILDPCPMIAHFTSWSTYETIYLSPSSLRTPRSGLESGFISWMIIFLFSQWQHHSFFCSHSLQTRSRQCSAIM